MSGGPTGRGVFDPGLQPERTTLAWRRTSLTVLAGSAAGGRLLAPQLGVLGVVLGVGGGAFAVWLYVAAAVRSRAVTRELLRAGGLGEGPGAVVLAATVALCVLLGGFAAWLVLDHGLRGILTSR